MKAGGSNEPEIREEKVDVKVYSWACDKCGRRLHHYHPGTLKSNITEHKRTRHGEIATRSEQLKTDPATTRKDEKKARGLASSALKRLLG